MISLVKASAFYPEEFEPSEARHAPALVHHVHYPVTKRVGEISTSPESRRSRLKKTRVFLDVIENVFNVNRGLQQVIKRSSDQDDSTNLDPVLKLLDLTLDEWLELFQAPLRKPTEVLIGNYELAWTLDRHLDYTQTKMIRLRKLGVIDDTTHYDELVARVKRCLAYRQRVALEQSDGARQFLIFRGIS